MQYLTGIIFLVFLFIIFKFMMRLIKGRTFIIYDFHQGILWRKGQAIKVLMPGKHRLFLPSSEINTVDMRTSQLSFTDSIISLDKKFFNFEVNAESHVTDPIRYISQSADSLVDIVKNELKFLLLEHIQRSTYWEITQGSIQVFSDTIKKECNQLLEEKGVQIVRLSINSFTESFY